MAGANDGSWHAHVPAEEPGRRVVAPGAAGHPICLWLTGLPGSGKSTVSERLLVRLRAQGLRAISLDGDALRSGLNRDLGFTDSDRHENIRRAAEVARLMVDAGMIAIVSLISPFQTDREFARSRFGRNEFFEIFVDAPLEVCERRDPKGLYAKARRGELTRMTGIDSPYEPPHRPDLHLRTGEVDPDESVDRMLDWLVDWGLIADCGVRSGAIPIRAARG